MSNNNSFPDSAKLYAKITQNAPATKPAAAEKSAAAGKTAGKTRQTKSDNKGAAQKSDNRRSRGIKKKPAAKKATQGAQNTNFHSDARANAAVAKVATNKKKNAKAPAGETLRIIPLGGLGEVGKNMTVYEYAGDIIIVDCGLKFPDDELLGVDIVIPDFTYLLNNRSRIRGMVITHGHEDHIGALPYFLRDISIPVYATKLTIGLIKAKFKEFPEITGLNLNVISFGQTIKLGAFSLESINVNHSIPDATAFAITCGAGTVIHTGDFKIDYTPISDRVINLPRFGEYGEKGVLALLTDSTNAERPGYTHTERTVGNTFDMLVNKAQRQRIIIASFASNIQRIQQIFNVASRNGRKVALSGRSVINYTEIAAELGYLKINEGVLIDISEINKYRDDQLIIITTGSQGEPLSALSRMAAGTHRQVSITPNDIIIISATPIPGNETSVNKTINSLLKLGSEVIYESMYDVHVSGHACQEEIKTMIDLVHPKYYIPIHGEYKHLMKNARLAEDMGIDKNNIIIPEIGNVISLSAAGCASGAETVPSGRVLVDGIGVGDVGSIVLRDRKHLAQDGLIVAVVSLDSKTGELISGPDIISRGFVYVREAEQLMEEARRTIVELLGRSSVTSVRDWPEIKIKIREALSELMYQRTKRSPMILPVIMEV